MIDNNVNIEMMQAGQAPGDVASVLLANGGDVRALRPYLGKDNRTYITRNVGGIPTAVPVFNTTATLRKEEWLLFDEALVRVAKPRLQAVSDLRGRGLEFTIPNGMATTVLQTETVSDISPAVVSMDGLREGATDRPLYELGNLPLPIVHKDFHFSLRELLASRKLGAPLDTTNAELAGRRVAEEIERLLLGNSIVADEYSYGGGVIYGYTDFPSRLTRTITAPTAEGWGGATFTQDIMAMMQQSRDAFHYGPWVLYLAPAWSQYIGDDYKAASDKTIRNRALEIDGLSDIKTLDYLTGFTMILVEMVSSTVREIVGMEITTLQWDTQGGMQKNFKVMAIMVPQLRADQDGNTGIVHGEAE